MLRHGVGVHRAAGTCQVPHEEAEAVLADVLAAAAAGYDVNSAYAAAAARP